MTAGMNASLHAWHQHPCNGTDRRDGIDGWGSDVIDWVQRAFNKFMVADVGVLTKNPRYVTAWPKVVDAYRYSNTTRGTIKRSIIMFNDALSDAWEPWAPSRLTLRWRADWDVAGGAGSDPVDSGIHANVSVTVGFYANVSVITKVPDPGSGAAPEGRRLFFAYSSHRTSDAAAPPLYVEDRVYVLVSQ